MRSPDMKAQATTQYAEQILIAVVGASVVLQWDRAS
jgi:hypothetical protein